MRLQNKNFTFTLASNDKPMSRIITSALVIDNKLTTILVSDLFIGLRKERGNVVKGFSILELIKNNKIEINARVYELTFSGDKDNFNLTSIDDPTGFILNDKEINDEQLIEFEKLIETNAPEKLTTQEQPLNVESTNEEIQSAGDVLFTNEDYNFELQDLQNDGYVEYNTSPRSNMKLLVNERDENAEHELIEIEHDNFAILDLNEYEIKTNREDKTFTLTRVDNVVDK